jgi:hypothetical protein
MKFEIPKPLQQVSNDLGSLGVFLIMRWIVGLKGAILATVLYVVIDLIRRVVVKEKLTRIFWIISMTTIGFGTVDVLVDDPFMLKFEAVLSNLITAFVFAGTVSGTPLALEIARTWQTTEIPDRTDTRRFFQIMTWIWVGYFVLKAGLYLWAAIAFDTTIAMAVRVPIGTGSLLAMILFSMQGRRWFHLMKRFGWLPA